MEFDWLKMNLFVWLLWGAYWFIQSKKVNGTNQSESSISRIGHLLPMVMVFFLVFGPTVIFFHFNDRVFDETQPVQLFGTSITFLGLAFAVWARNHLGKYWSGIITLKEGHRLIRTGPYRWVRHPIYTGFFFGILGSAICLGKVRGFVAVILALTSHWIKIRKEEKVLVDHFGDDYLQFKKETKALIPFLL